MTVNFLFENVETVYVEKEVNNNNIRTTPIPASSNVSLDFAEKNINQIYMRENPELPSVKFPLTISLNFRQNMFRANEISENAHP